jgi:hypothetical protein
MKFPQSFKYVIVLSSTVFLATPVFAESPAVSDPAVKKEAEKTAPAPVAPVAPAASVAPTAPATPVAPAKFENPIISVATADFNADKKTDSAILIRADDQANLYIYVNNAKGGSDLALVKKAVVWTGALAGTFPQLTAAKGGTLYIDSQNEAVGRDRWHQRLTIDYRDNDFIVAGYSYGDRDTLEPAKPGLSCDVNLLTGKGVKNKEAFKLDGQKIKLTDWTDDKAPKQCRN